MATLPTHLGQSSAMGMIQGEPVAQFELGDYKNFVYMIVDWTSRKAACVDPQADLAPLLEALTHHSLELSMILLTHTHHDHIAGVPELARRFKNVPIVLHSLDTHRLPRELSSAPQLRPLTGDATLQLGDLEISAIHTPGHSAGECSYFFNSGRPYLLTGDTIFIRDCGRTDFPDGSDEQMFSSIQLIKKLPLNTVFLPGHHYQRECATTLELELMSSPPFQVRTVAELAALV